MKRNFKLKNIFISSLTALLLTGSASPFITQRVVAADLSSFADYNLVATHWAKEPLEYLISTGAMSGILKEDGQTYVSSNSTITRAEFSVLLLNLLDPGFKIFEDKYIINTVEPATLTDYGLPAWYNEYASLLNEVAAGYGASAEDWQKPITRAEVATLISSICRLTYLDGVLNVETLAGIERNIADRNAYQWIPNWPQIERLYSNGIICGDENGNYLPLNNLTRAEAAAILQRLGDPSKRLEVEVALAEENGIDRDSMVIEASDPFHRQVQDGDTFIDKNGTAWTVKWDAVLGVYNPDDPVDFYSGLIDNYQTPLSPGYVSDGTYAKHGEGLVQAPNGRVDWYTNWQKLAAAEYGKPTTPGTTDLEKSPNSYWYWSELFNQWLFFI